MASGTCSRPPDVCSLLATARHLLRRLGAGIPFHHGDISEGGRGVIGDPLHDAADDLDAKTAAPLPNVGVAEVGPIVTLGIERDSLIPNEKRAGPYPVELDRLRGVLLVPVLRDVGAGFVEGEVEASEYFPGQSPEHLGAFQPLADAAHGF